MRQSMNKRGTVSLGLVGGLVLLLLSLGVVMAAGEAIPRSLISGGGGQVSGDGLQLRSAIGQPVVGTVGDGPSVCSGFVCGPGAPGASGAEDVFLLYLPMVER